MLKLCGKTVNFTRTTRSITSAQSSTSHIVQYLASVSRSVKPMNLHDFFRIHTQGIPQVKTAFSPLVEHYFYPVSTGPINTPTK